MPNWPGRTVFYFEKFIVVISAACCIEDIGGAMFRLVVFKIDGFFSSDETRRWTIIIIHEFICDLNKFPAPHSIAKIAT